MVLLAQVRCLPTRAAAARRTARARRPSNRCTGLLRLAACPRPRLLPDDRAAPEGRGLSLAPVVFRPSVGDAVLSGGNLPRRERSDPRLPVLRPQGTPYHHLQRTGRRTIYPRSHSLAGGARGRIELCELAGRGCGHCRLHDRHARALLDLPAPWRSSHGAADPGAPGSRRTDGPSIGGRMAARGTRAVTT